MIPRLSCFTTLFHFNANQRVNEESLRTRLPEFFFIFFYLPALWRMHSWVVYAGSLCWLSSLVADGTPWPPSPAAWLLDSPPPPSPVPHSHTGRTAVTEEDVPVCVCACICVYAHNGSEFSKPLNLIPRTQSTACNTEKQEDKN